MMEVLFDNEGICEQFNIYLAERPVIPVAEMEYETINVEGRNGPLTRELGYRLKPLILRYNYIHKEHVKQTFRQVVNWLTGRRTLSLSDDPEVYRIISQLNVTDAINSHRQYVGFDIEVETEPFWYQYDGVMTIDSTATIINPSKIPAPFILKVFGDGTCNVKINDNDMTFRDVQGQLIVDGILKTAYRGLRNENNNMTGGYPLLQTGENTISISGNTDRIEIEKRWCWR